MKALTIDTYFDVLEKCTLEAFESFKLKDFYPKDGTKAIWDLSTFTIEMSCEIPLETKNDLIRKKRFFENLRITFLTALERHCKKFKKKYSIESSYFYKKCFEALLWNITQNELWNEPDFGFNIDLKPDVLTFIWNMRTDIEMISKEQKPEVKEATTNNKQKEKDLTTQKWFKTGIALATGEAFDIFKKIGNRPTEICRKIKVPESNKTYISATTNNSKIEKNLFNSTNKLKALHKHLTENNLNFGTEFLKKYNQIEPD